jgi:hypothetical protein
MMPGMPEKRTRDYARHGTTSLFAAFNVAHGTVISSLHRRHRSTEFRKFLAKIDTQVPDDLEVHLICDNYATHKHPIIIRWLQAGPPHRSVQAIEKGKREWVKAWNENTRPFISTTSTEEILASLARLLQRTS